MDLLVKCDYHTAGCPWTGQLKNWQVRREGGRNDKIVLALSVHNTSLSPSPLFLSSFTIPPPFPSPFLSSSFLLSPLSLPPSLLLPSQNHIDVCVFRAVVCPNKGCEAVLPYHQLESHEQNCSFRRVSCEHCHIEITISQLEVRR